MPFLALWLLQTFSVGIFNLLGVVCLIKVYDNYRRSIGIEASKRPMSIALAAFMLAAGIGLWR